MAHYATLDEYHFSADVDDIRGANLYSSDNKKIGKVKDVIFDHQTGEIRYLVVDAGLDRKVLVPSSHLYRFLADEEDFETDISAIEIGELPRFDESMLKDEKQWREHEEEHRTAWKEQEKRLLAEYKQKWHESPVQHRKGSDLDITPDMEPESASPAEAGERIVTGADLFPRRIAGKFPGADPMVSPGNPDPGETTLQPAREQSGEASVFGSAPQSPRWHGFQENIRQNLEDIRARCITCCRPSESRVA
jgi:sporulation protein YlmC with PRC-barrel domain